MNIKECISYLEGVINYLSGISDEKRNYYLESLNKIKQRENDPNLNVAIIGDFSSGKSTFINAFIQKDILKTAWLATTAIPTRILYHNENETKIIVRSHEGISYDLTEDSQRRKLEKMLGVSLSGDDKSVVAILSTRNDLSGKISEIILYVSSFKELKKICIIDTPGVNPGDERAREHVRQTQSVLRDYADATIILFKSMNVLTNSFNIFLEENAGHFMNDAIFVITMMDTADEGDRGEIMEYAKSGISQRFHIDNPKLYSCSAVYAEPGRNEKEGEHWRQEFDFLRQDLIKYMRRRRNRIIKRQISRLLQQLIVELKDDVERNTTLIEEQLRLLEANSIENLKIEMDANNKTYSKLVEKTWRSIEFKNRYDSMFDGMIEDAKQGINACDTIRGSGRYSIDGYIRSYLPTLMESRQKIFTEELNAELSKLNDHLEDHYNENERLFRKFSVNIGTSAGTGNNGVRQLTYENDLGKVEYSDENLAEVLAFLTGEVALIPLAIVDGFLGTDISGTLSDTLFDVMDGIVNIFGNLSSRKEKAIVTVKSSLNDKKNENRQGFLDTVDKYKADIENAMKKTEKGFAGKYHEIYSARKEEFEFEKRSLEVMIESNMATQNKLESYLSELNKERMDDNGFE